MDVHICALIRVTKCDMATVLKGEWQWTSHMLSNVKWTFSLEDFCQPCSSMFRRLLNQCCREILFLFNRLFRDISRNEDLIAIFISRYIINIYDQFIISYSLLWWLPK